MALLEESRGTATTHVHAAAIDPRSRTRCPRAHIPTGHAHVITDTDPSGSGDLAVLGLAGWSLSGLSSWLLELVKDSTGLPWFHTIVAGTLISRLLLLNPLLRQFCS